MPHQPYANLTLLDHPLVHHKITLLRDVHTTTKDFRDLVSELAQMVAYEATRDLPLQPHIVETPLERFEGRRIAGKKPVLVPILRAGLGMVSGVERLLPNARVGHIGLERDEKTFQANHYYFKIPGHAEERLFLLLDPMLATGGSAVRAIATLKGAGARQIRLLCLVAAPEGLERVARDHPDVPVFAAALDRELNDRAYILPGLGDAGDRSFGTK